MGAAVASVLGVGSSIIANREAESQQERLLNAQNAANEKIAEQNAAITRMDAEAARGVARNIAIQGNNDLALKMIELKALRSQIKQGYASRGVAVNTGSALNQQVTTQKAIARDMNVISYNARVKAEQAMSEADKYEAMAEAGILNMNNQALAIENAYSNMGQGQTAATIIGGISDLAQAGTFNSLFNGSTYSFGNDWISSGSSISTGSGDFGGYTWDSGGSAQFGY